MYMIGDKKLAGGYNWAAAFASYCQGLPSSEVAMIHAIPENLLLSRMDSERWTSIAAKLNAGGAALQTTSMDEAKLKARMELMAENRKKNFDVACKLRDDLVEVVDKLRRGELKLEKQWCHKGMVVRAEVDLGIGDRLNLANYARTVCDLTYAALGDRAAGMGAKDDGPAASSSPTPPPITIVLPGLISRPRSERGTDEAKEGPAIEVETVPNKTG
jgi:hypothetical protein